MANLSNIASTRKPPANPPGKRAFFKIACPGQIRLRAPPLAEQGLAGGFVGGRSLGIWSSSEASSSPSSGSGILEQMPK
jgi:hypothetical protein